MMGRRRWGRRRGRWELSQLQAPHLHSEYSLSPGCRTLYSTSHLTHRASGAWGLVLGLCTILWDLRFPETETPTLGSLIPSEASNV